MTAKPRPFSLAAAAFVAVASCLAIPSARATTRADVEPDWDPATAAARPVPMAPSGPVTSGYSTTLWESGAIAADDALHVVSSTAPGTTALTGVVTDESGLSVSGASVTLGCSATCSISSVTTTTDSQGAFAFINMPAGMLDLEVQASGFGVYGVINDAYEADTTSQITVFLTSRRETFDMAGGAGSVAGSG